MPDLENGFFNESISYSHFRIVFNLTTIYVSLFYYDTTVMENVFNFNYTPRYLTDDFFFLKLILKQIINFR